MTQALRLRCRGIMRSLALIVVAVAPVLASCLSSPPPVFPPLPGYNFSLPFPRGDIKPGTVLVRWKDGTVLPPLPTER